MHKLIPLGVSLLLAVPGQGAAQDQLLALVGGMLPDGYQAPPIHHAAVVIENGRIVAVGPRGQAKIPVNARVIDTRGRTMMPGIIDLHVHLMIEPGTIEPGKRADNIVITGNPLFDINALGHVERVGKGGIVFK